jgi:phosphoribosyl 1,2-cyclic phosphate phosphodiesterase
MSQTSNLQIIVLGSGTSAGVPMIGCHCPVCSSIDPRDRRTRCSLAVRYDQHEILIDTAPELRLQAVGNALDRVEAVVFTHAHADHIFGLDDIRRYNTVLGRPIGVYANAETLGVLQRAFPYAFNKLTDTGVYRPELVPHVINGPFDLLGRTWTPIPLRHGRGDVLGFRIGNFAYCTDCSQILPQSMALLQNLDTLIIDALRPHPHPTHFSFTQAVAMINNLKPRQAFLTHLSHDVFHAQAEADLPAPIKICYDGMQLSVTL